MKVEKARQITNLALNHDAGLYFAKIIEFIKRNCILGNWENKMSFTIEGMTNPSEDTKRKISAWLEKNGYTYAWADNYLFISWK